MSEPIKREVLKTLIDRANTSCRRSDWKLVESADTSEITDISKLFYGLNDIPADLDLSGCDVSNVTDMSLLFYNSDFNNNSISNQNTSNVTEALNLFDIDTFPMHIDLSAWNVSDDESFGLSDVRQLKVLSKEYKELTNAVRNKEFSIKL